MAYGLKYQAGWNSPKNRKGYLYIDQDGWTGAVTDLKLAGNGLKLSYPWEDWNSPIMGLRLEFDIVNDKTDYFELLPLLSAEEKEYKIRLVVTAPESYTMFEGFLNCDTITQKYLHKQTIRFAASSYLSKLDNHHPTSIDTLQNKIFINLIDEILVSTGASYNIRVNSTIHAEGDIIAAEQTFLNKNGIYTELFWTDNIERMTALEILKSILTSFDCYIYWYRGYWYIERYADIYKESVYYVEYTTGTTYGPASTGSHTTIVKAITDIHALQFIEQSQTMAIIPGMKTIQINLNDKRLANLVSDDLLGMVPVSATPPAPEFRHWQYSNSEAGFNIISWGKPRNFISNSIYRTMTLPFTYNVESGIFTSIKTTVIDETTALSIKFKYVVDPSFTTAKYDELKFYFRWYLREAGTSNYVCQSTEDTTDWNLYAAEQADYLNTVTIEGSSFDIKNNGVEVAFSIPLGLVDVMENSLFIGKLIGDKEFILGLCVEYIKINNSTDNYYASDVWIGDILVTATGDLQDNIIKGDINSKFLNKKEISIDLYDGLGFDYKNSILMGTDMSVRTKRWGSAGAESEIVARGVCWGVSANPVIAMDHTEDSTGIGVFISHLKGLTVGQLYHVRAYMTDASGTTTYGQDEIFTTRLYAPGDPYGGGVVAYVYKAGDPGYTFDVDGVQHGIIAALSDQYDNEHSIGFRIYWGSLAHDFLSPPPKSPSSIGYALGDGHFNSPIIDNGHPQYSQFANKICLDYVVGGYTDWVFPSILELHKLYINRIAIGGFANNWYWSSTAANLESTWEELVAMYPAWKTDIEMYEDRFAWCMNFAITANDPMDVTVRSKKNDECRIRPIRYF